MTNETSRACACANCEWTGTEQQLEYTLYEIRRLAERLDAGGEVPAGTCPNCGALVYLVKQADPLREAAPAMLAALMSIEIHICRARDRVDPGGTGRSMLLALDICRAAIAKAEGRS